MLTSLVLLSFAVLSTSAEQINLNAPGTDAKLAGNRFLIITPNINSGIHLGNLLTEFYGAEIVVKHSSKYVSYIDEEVYDAFIYLGNDYFQPPDLEFVEDIQRTQKPVLWIGYHGWELGKDFLAARDIEIFDDHATGYTHIEYRQSFDLTATDSTLIQSDHENVLYWLISESASDIPGAVVAGNFTFIGYLPAIDIFAPDFPPLLAAIKATFGKQPAPVTAKKADFKQRVFNGLNDDFRTGVHLPVYIARSSETEYGYEHNRWHENLVRIKRTGAEWVSLVRTFIQTDRFSVDVHADDSRTPSLESLSNIISDAHAIGLKVQINLMLNLQQRGPTEWHGIIRPANLDEWWHSYRSLVLEMAEFSLRNEVEALVIGNEYASLQDQDENWRDLVTEIRQQVNYNGMLGYSVNYNSKNLPWYDAVDFIGVSAYWPLSEDRNPTLETLIRSWSEIDAEIKTWIEAHPAIRVEFTEAGYVSQPYASVLPFSWKPHRGKAQDLNEQLLSYTALYNYLESTPEIKGIHIFASTSEDNDPESIGYTPFGKPAESVVQQIMKLR